MTKKRERLTPHIEGRDVFAAVTGGVFTVVDEGGIEESSGPPVAPMPGTKFVYRVVHRCVNCAAVVGHVREWRSGDTVVVLFEGQRPAHTPGSGEEAHRLGHEATFTRLDSAAAAAEPETWCWNHGRLKLSVHDLHQCVSHSRLNEASGAGPVTLLHRLSRRAASR